MVEASTEVYEIEKGAVKRGLRKKWLKGPEDKDEG